MIGQRSDVFPDRDGRGEIQDIAQNGITLGTWGIWQGGSPPFPDDNEDKNAKQQEIKDRYHGDRERTGGIVWPFLCRWWNDGICRVDDVRQAPYRGPEAVGCQPSKTARA